jgi:nucleoside-diphosphate-sugar epimerase
MMSSAETFFITGFPGFIASRLVQRLAVADVRFILLVQPAFLERAREEIVSIVRSTNTRPESFRVLAGDITQPALGMTAADSEIARHETTAVFHLAAIYDLAVARDLAMRVNLEGTRNVNSFVRSIPNLRRYHYVSTCYVAGLRQGLIRESELRHEAGFRNNYEETKYLAELEVEALKSELPVTIHRPAVVCGDSQTGETAKYDGVYYLIQYLRMWPAGLTLVNIGNRNVSLNLVPIDFVINAMVALAEDERAVGATVQLADPAPLATHELFDEIAQQLSGRRSLVTLPAASVRPALMLPFSEKLSGLPHAAVPYFFLEQTYDTTQAKDLLDPHHIHCPPFSDYVKNLIAFVAQHPTL